MTTKTRVVHSTVLDVNDVAISYQEDDRVPNDLYEKKVILTVENNFKNKKMEISEIVQGMPLRAIYTMHRTLNVLNYIYSLLSKDIINEVETKADKNILELSHDILKNPNSPLYKYLDKNIIHAIKLLEYPSQLEIALDNISDILDEKECIAIF